MTRKRGKAPSRSQAKRRHSVPPVKPQPVAVVDSNGLVVDLLPSYQQHGVRIPDPPYPRPEGRQSIITQEIADILIAGAQAGLQRDTIAEEAGITRDTLYRWLRLGRQGIQPYADLERAMTKRRTQIHTRIVSAIVDKAASGDVAAADFYLSRTDPEHWGKKHLIEVTLKSEFDAFFRYLQTALEPAVYEAVLNAAVTYGSGGQDQTARLLLSPESDVIDAQFAED